MIFFAVIFGRGGYWVGDPVKAAFHGRKGNIYGYMYCMYMILIFIKLFFSNELISFQWP